MIKHIISKEVVDMKQVRKGKEREYVYSLNKDKIKQCLEIYKRYDKKLNNIKPCILPIT